MLSFQNFSDDPLPKTSPDAEPQAYLKSKRFIEDDYCGEVISMRDSLFPFGKKDGARDICMSNVKSISHDPLKRLLADFLNSFMDEHIGFKCSVGLHGSW